MRKCMRKSSWVPYLLQIKYNWWDMTALARAGPAAHHRTPQRQSPSPSQGQIPSCHLKELHNSLSPQGVPADCARLAGPAPPRDRGRIPSSLLGPDAPPPSLERNMTVSPRSRSRCGLWPSRSAGWVET
uniref:Uncharacterized protein n=1 Tax=Sphaerodactylus townsendi TaxID=933632 RepID=A0ACB8EJ87_9SAUR